MLTPIERHWKANSGSDSDKVEPVYDWEVRMIRPDAFSKQYVAAVAGSERDETKVWNGQRQCRMCHQQCWRCG
jgi:hypothetical protein